MLTVAAGNDSHPLPPDAAGSTHPGLVRERNEDAFLCDPQSGVFAVADGLGGHAGGQIASSLALTAVRRACPERSRRVPRARLSGSLTPATIEAALEVCAAAEQAIQRYRRQRPDLATMGTTLTCLWLETNLRGLVLHIGDSRLYGLEPALPSGRGGPSKLPPAGRQTGRDVAWVLRQLTSDHNLAAREVAMGRLTAAQAERSWQQSQLTRCIGRKPPAAPDVFTLDCRLYTALLLCTDGLNTTAPAAVIRTVLKRYYQRPSLAADRLVAAALEEGGGDNVTVIVVNLSGAGST